MEGTPNEEFPAPARAGVKPDPLDSPSGPNYSNVYIKRENARSSACTESSIVQRLFEPASPLKVRFILGMWAFCCTLRLVFNILNTIFKRGREN